MNSKRKKTASNPNRRSHVSKRIDNFENANLITYLRGRVVPWLKTFPSTKIWINGCSAPSEIYGLAVLLREEGLDRFTIYATDSSQLQLMRAKKGTIAPKEAAGFERKYLQANRGKNLGVYAEQTRDKLIFRDELKRYLSFFSFHVGVDSSPNEFQLILCREKVEQLPLQTRQRVGQLFSQSLCKFGLLGVRSPKLLLGSGWEEAFQEVEDGLPLYKRMH